MSHSNAGTFAQSQWQVKHAFMTTNSTIRKQNNRKHFHAFFHIESIHPKGESKMEKEVEEMENEIDEKYMVFEVVCLHINKKAIGLMAQLSAG